LLVIASRISHVQVFAGCGALQLLHLGSK
jgi:hypothetical protein